MKKSFLENNYTKPENDIDILHYDYSKDISRHTIKQFEKKGIKQSDLKE